MRTTVTLNIVIEHDSEDALDDTVEAMVTWCENTTPAKGVKIIEVREG